MHASVHPFAGAAELLLHQRGEAHALRHVFVLHELEDDVRLRRVGIEPGIACLIVVFVEDDGVFAFGYFQIGFGFGQPQRPCGGSSRRMVSCQGIGVDGDEQVRLGFIGNLRPAVESDKHIPLAGVDDLHVRAVLLYQTPYGQGNFQVDVLLFRDAADGSRVMSSVSGVDDHHEVAGICLSVAESRRQQPATDAYI